MPGIIVPFVGETHRDAIAIVGPKFLDQPVVELLRPLSFEKFDDLLPATVEIRRDFSSASRLYKQAPPFLDRENSSHPPLDAPSEWQSQA